MLRFRFGAAVAVVVLALVVSACSASRENPQVGGPLGLEENMSGVGLAIDPGATMTYGDVVVANDGPDPIVLVQVDLVAADDGATVDDVRVLAVDDVPDGTLIGEGLGFHPPAAAVPVSGATIAPSNSDHRKNYQFLFAVRLRGAGPARFNSVRVAYTVNGVLYVKTAGYRLRLCTPSGADCAPDDPPAG